MMQGSAQAGSLVKVFIRTRDKKARGLLLPRQISGNQLKKIASEKTHIPLDSLTLFNQGQEIQQEAQLQDNNIIHAIDLRNVHTDNIHLYVKLLAQTAAREKYSVNTNTLIKDFISDNLLRLYEVNLDDIFLVYTGKQVDIQRNFKEELIENESEVICVKVKSIQQKAKDQDKIHHKVSHEVKHEQGEHKQEHDDKTIRIATKVAKLNTESNGHVLRSGKPDHHEQTEVIVSMKEVEENQQKVHEKVTQLHEANVETEQQEEVFNEAVPENHVIGLAHHEEIVDPVESHAVLHSSAPAVDYSGHFQFKYDQPQTLDIHAEAEITENDEPRLVLNLNGAQIDHQPAEESPQALKSSHGESDHVEVVKQQLIVNTQIAQNEESDHLVLQEPHIDPQIKEHAVVEEITVPETVIEEKFVPEHIVQAVSIPAQHIIEHQEDQKLPQSQVKVVEEQSESPQVIASQQIAERLESKPTEEEQSPIPSEEKVSEAPLPVQQTYENAEAIQNEIVESKEEEPVAQEINLQAAQQEDIQHENTVNSSIRPSLKSVFEEPVLFEPIIQKQEPGHHEIIQKVTQELAPETTTQIENDHLLDEVKAQDEQPVPVTPLQTAPIYTQNKFDNLPHEEAHEEITLKSEPHKQEHKTEDIQINQIHKDQIPLANANESIQTELKEQTQEPVPLQAAPLIQHEESVVQHHQHEEPVKVEENKPQDIRVNEHEAVPALEGAEETHNTQHYDHSQETLVKTYDIAQDQTIKAEHQTTPVLESEPIDIPKQISNPPQENIVQNVEIEQIEHHNSQQALHQDRVSSAAADVELIQQETTDNHEEPLVAHAEATLDAVHHHEPVEVEEVRQQVHQRITQTVQIKVTEIPIIVEYQELEAPVAVESLAVVESEPLAIHSQNKAQAVAENVITHEHLEQEQRINDPEVVEDKYEHAQHLAELKDAENNQSEVREQPKVDAIHTQNPSNTLSHEIVEPHQQVQIHQEPRLEAVAFRQDDTALVSGDLEIIKDDGIQNPVTVHAEAPIEEKTHYNEHLIHVQQHNEPAKHQQFEPIIQVDIPIHQELQQIHIEQADKTVALHQQNFQQEETVEAKLEQPTPIQVVEYHSEGHAAVEPVLNSHHIAQPEHKQQEHNSDNAHKVQAESPQALEAEHRQASEVEATIDDDYTAKLRETPAEEVEVPEINIQAQGVPAVHLEHYQIKQIENKQPAIEHIQEHHHEAVSVPTSLQTQPQAKLQNEIEQYIIKPEDKLEDNGLPLVESKQEAVNHPVEDEKLEESHQAEPQVEQHVENVVLESAPLVNVQEQNVDHSQAELIIQEAHKSNIEPVGESNPVLENVVAENSAEQVPVEKAVAETGHQWEVKEQPHESVPIVLNQQWFEQNEEITTHQNEPITEENIESDGHHIELKADMEEASKPIGDIEEIVHQEPTICPQAYVNPKYDELLQERQEHQEVVIEAAPVVETAIIEASQTVADHQEDIRQKLQSHPSEPQHQQIPVAAQVLKQSDNIHHKVHDQLEEAEAEKPNHTEGEVATLHQQQLVQEPSNHSQTIKEEPEAQQLFNDEVHEDVAALQAETPVVQQAVQHQYEPEAKVVVLEEISHEMKEEVTLQHAQAEPVKHEAQHVAQTEQALQVQHDQYSQLPYVSSSQLPLSQNTSSSFANISHNNLEIIAHLKLETPSQFKQKGVAFEELKVKSPHSTTNECLIYQEQIIHKTGNQQISIVKQAEEVPEGNKYQHAAPFPIEHAEPSLIDNINQEEPLSVITANEATD